MGKSKTLNFFTRWTEAERLICLYCASV